MCPILWLYVSCRGYAWLYVVIYCKCTEKESEPRNDTQGRPPFIMTAATSRKYYIRWFYVVIHPTRGYTFESVLIQWFFSRCVNILLGKPRGGYVSHTVVIRLMSWLCVVIRGYILHMYPKGTITFRRWFYMVIRSKPWLYAPVRGYTTFCSPYASAAYQETPAVVMSPRAWLYVSYRGYLWLYTTYVPRRYHNLQTMVLHGYTIKTVAIRPSS